MFPNFKQLLSSFLCFGLIPFSIPLFASDHIDLYLKWYHQFQFAGYYTALEKGYYRELGLDVSIHESKNGIEGLHQLISEKEARYGVGANEVLLQWHAGAPIFVIAVIFQHSPIVLFTKKTHPDQSVQDLVGKKIMLSPHVYEILALLKKEKLDPSRFRQLPHSFRFLDIVESKVDALDGYSTTQTYELEKMGFPLMVFSPRTSGIDFYGDNLFTSKLEIENNPTRVKKFREASLRGWDYAMKHKQEIVNLISEKYASSIPKEQLLFEAEQMEPLIQPSLVEIGYMYEGRWKHINEVYADFGMLPKNLDLSGFLYNANPKPNYESIFSILILLLFIVLVAWVIQRYRWNKRYSETLKTEVLLRTEELKISNNALNSTNLVLESKLKELTEAQEKLLNREKLATIGNLTAGMAHELNTPLGAIVSSNGAISDFFQNQFQTIINYLFTFSNEDKERFYFLIREYQNIQNVFYTGKKEREFKKELEIEYAEIFQKYLKDDREEYLNLIVDSSAFLLGDHLKFILESDHKKEILTMGSKVASVFRSCSIISTASEKSSHVVKSLKNYLISDDLTHSDQSKIDITSEIETILTLYYYNINHRVKVQKHFLSHRKCKGNRDNLNLVWVNLLNNALYAISFEGIIELTIEDDGPWIKVSFIDYGSGIPKNIQDRIFEPFFTTKSKGEGVGLGLDICRKVINKMNGKIEFESEVGKTKFTVYLLAEE
ncbi:ABC transporter substrate-binding protein [Leptospira levettii]|uniref:histidine kinase n=1 Tax=Leptospira levettii TaxID=2023178 RepID=A0ABY2MRF5_9LEPT|nr:ABC transporter substrate-binding protein [Leptospira levettii]PKA25462.1 sensor histidine kinase [Leptospira sp. mixed culture ATI2-C-A1]TGL73408.1 GHKL domain-containing protein [Leptospira levettii]TGM29339.1 GHKL domain-containing protein [Leptospira levettii]